MPDYKFQRAVRENVPLLIGLAGASGSGKTYTAMTLAKGMAGDKRFAVIDTEAGRAKHYADQFAFDHLDIHPPFRPDTYLAAINAADRERYPVIVVDSMSHEWAGDGGILDWQEEEWAKNNHAEWARMSSWIKPKQGHKAMVSKLLQVRAHVILCFRAEPKIEMAKDEKGKTIVVEKKGPGGFKGWLPICEKNLPYELTASFLFMAEAPGVPIPMKLPAQLAPFFPLERQVTESAGRQLAAWARGGTAEPEVERGSVPLPADRAPSDTAGQGPDSGDGASTSRAPEPRGESGPGPVWSPAEFSELLKAATLTVSDLRPLIGPVTRDNWRLGVTAWLMSNPGKDVRDLIAAAVPPSAQDAEQAAFA